MLENISSGTKQSFDQRGEAEEDDDDDDDEEEEEAEKEEEEEDSRDRKASFNTAS
jgi:hypothetical protein